MLISSLCVCWINRCLSLLPSLSPLSFPPSLPSLPPSFPSGPQSPGVPASVLVLGRTHNSILIRFTVPIITYTPETYHVLYGTQMNNLNLTSIPITGSTDFSAMNQQFIVPVLGLVSDTTYYYRVRATNSDSSSETMLFNVTTLLPCKFGNHNYFTCQVCMYT